MSAVLGLGASTVTGPTVPKIYIRNVSALQDSAVANALPAFQNALDQDFGPLWKTRARLVFLGSAGAPPNSEVITISNQADVQNALGYHGLTTGGVPFAKVFYGTGIAYGYQWTVTLTHELFEMLADPSLTRTEQNPNNGTIWAAEDADPVEAESDGYVRKGADGKPVLISDFITDRWFGATTTGPYDFTNHVSAPLQVLKNGYAQYWNGTGWVAVTNFRAGHARLTY